MRPSRTATEVALVALGALAAAVFGMLLPFHPAGALALIGLVPLAFWAPALSLAVLLSITVLVPFEIQDQLAVLGGRGTPSLLVVDVLLLLGLCRIALLVVRGRLAVTGPLLAAAVLMFVLAAALLLGVLRGFDTSEAGHEARRVVLGPGAFLIAWPVLQEAAGRRRLHLALLVLGSLLGVWGLAQWLLGIVYETAGDIGVRRGVPFTSSGRGQLQGGLFAYPVAVTLAFAALFSTHLRSMHIRVWTGAVLAVNAICLLLTYERTFWAAAAVGCGVVVAASDLRLHQLRLRLPAITGAALVVAFAAAISGEGRTVVERLVSVSQYRSDIAVEYRVEEAKVLLGAVAEQPLLGAGFGSTITWGKRGVFGTITTSFAHNGYLWLAWKIGVPAAALTSLAMVVAVVRRKPEREDSTWAALRTGSRAAVLGLLLVNMTFPVFDALGITALTGFLVAAALCPPAAPLEKDDQKLPEPARANTPGPIPG